LSALSVLYFQPRPIALTALAAIEQVAQPTMSRIIRSLAAVGAVHRSGTLADKRVLLVEISPTGRQIFEQARERRLKLVRQIVLQLEPDALLALTKAVDALAQVLARPD
jgi:DNA-binding MarR family transcriptional regulator